MRPRRLVVFGVASAALIALVGWIAGNTTWETTAIRLPPTGEAQRNPFYAAQRFAEALGARTAWQHALGSAAPDGILVVSEFNWNLIPSRREAIARWVDDGGRLVVDELLLRSEDFSRWSGIRIENPRQGLARGGRRIPPPRTRCRITKDETGTEYRFCTPPSPFVLKSERPTLWSLTDDAGVQALRVAHGRGSITAINGSPFTGTRLLDPESDHGRLLSAAAALRRGDTLYFVSENRRPSLAVLIWQRGAPVVCLVALWLGLMLWRGGVRFGPPSPAPPPARRSLAEQIRGTARFAVRFGGSESLYAATLRAFTIAAGKRLPRLTSMDARDRATAIARIAGIDATALASALTIVDFHRLNDVRAAIALLEAARRQLNAGSKGSSHGA